MTDQTKKLIKIADICNLYSISRTALWRIRRLKGDDPFPKPLSHTLNSSIFFDAVEVALWFKRQFH